MYHVLLYRENSVESYHGGGGGGLLYTIYITEEDGKIKNLNGNFEKSNNNITLYKNIHSS